MNPWQMAQQLKHELEQVAWTTGSAGKVFGAGNRVRVVAGDLTDEQLPEGYPFVFVVLGDGVPDEDDHSLIEQTFDILTCVAVTGDPMGEAAVIGGSADLGESAGRGIAEIAARVFAAVGDLTGADGAKIHAASTRTGTPTLLTGHHVVLDERTLTALCTSQLHYAAPQEIAVASTAWTWEGTHCSDRFDFKQYRLFRKPGTSPPTSPSDAGAVLVYTGTTAGTTHTQVASNTYIAFADYSARQQSGVVEGSSGLEVGSFLST